MIPAAETAAESSLFRRKPGFLPQENPPTAGQNPPTADQHWINADVHEVFSFQRPLLQAGGPWGNGRWRIHPPTVPELHLPIGKSIKCCHNAVKVTALG
jgi:hypothetical protein